MMKYFIQNFFKILPVFRLQKFQVYRQSTQKLKKNQSEKFKILKKTYKLLRVSSIGNQPKKTTQKLKKQTSQKNSTFLKSFLAKFFSFN